MGWEAVLVMVAAERGEVKEMGLDSAGLATVVMVRERGLEVQDWQGQVGQKRRVCE